MWCLTVPDGEWFALANGAVTHNSADAFRYLAMAYREIKPEAKVVEQPIKGIMDMTWDDLLSNQPKAMPYERA